MHELAAARDMHDIRIHDIGAQPRLHNPAESLVPGGASQGGSLGFIAFLGIIIAGFIAF